MIGMSIEHVFMHFIYWIIDHDHISVTKSVIVSGMSPSYSVFSVKPNLFNWNIPRIR